MNNLKRVIDNFQDVIVLTKLGFDKRTPETLAKQYSKAKSLWTSTKANYPTMMDLSEETWSTFMPKYEAAEAIFL